MTSADSSSVPLFTIFIPTYNRAYILPRALASIETQTYQDFEVLIIDDGSKDSTLDVVQEWRKQATFPVHYHYQTNSGKHVAYNTMLGLARGELVVLLDSDDALKPEALERFKHHWETIPSEQRGQFAGVEGLCAYLPDYRLAGKPFPKDILDSNYIDIHIKLGVSGEKRGAFHKNVLRQFFYPVFPNERYIRPSWAWNRIAAQYRTRYFNEVVQVLEHQTDSHSNNLFSRRMASPRGLRLCIAEEIQFYSPFLTPHEKRRLYANYVRYSLHAGANLLQQYREINVKTLWLSGVLSGGLHWLWDRLRLKSAS